MSNNIEVAKEVLLANSKVLYGIFSIIRQTDCFPPCAFLNEFFLVGNDPCDQDRRMNAWRPFELSKNEYLVVKSWWLSLHPTAQETTLGAEDWNDWVQEVLEMPSK